MTPSFSTDPDVVGAAIMLTSLVVTVVLLAIMGIAAVLSSTGQCRARRAGQRCIYDEHHAGSHRDPYGDYWNDPTDRIP